MSRTGTVAVIGGGVIGCTVARELAPDYDVLVIERGQIAGGATALSAGLVTITPSYSDVPAIRERANAFFRAYHGTGQFSYTERASLELVPPDRSGEARRRVDRLRAAGCEVAFLTPETIAERYPRVAAESLAGGVEFTETGWLDPYTLATTLQNEAEANGAQFETGTTVTEITADTEGVTGLETDSGAIGANIVIAAAGWQSPELLGEHIQLPVRPYRTQCLVVDPGASYANGPIGWYPDEHVYFRPEHNGDLLVGGWSFVEDNPEEASADADEAFRIHVAELLPEIFTDLPDPRFVDGWAGIDGATPDTRPIIDAPGGMPGEGRRASQESHPEVPRGLLVATGFHGRGVMTAPVAADAVRALLGGENPGFPMETFALDRFEDYSPDFEFTSVSS